MIEQKVADQERSGFPVVFTMIFCALEYFYTNIKKFAVSNHTALDFGIQPLIRYL